MLEDEVISPQQNPSPLPDQTTPVITQKTNRTKLVVLLAIPITVLIILWVNHLLAQTQQSPPNPTLSFKTTQVPTRSPDLVLEYPFASNSALLQIEASVSGTVDPNINQLLYLLQLPDVNQPINP